MKNKTLTSLIIIFMSTLLFSSVSFADSNLDINFSFENIDSSKYPATVNVYKIYNGESELISPTSDNQVVPGGAAYTFDNEFKPHHSIEKSTKTYTVQVYVFPDNLVSGPAMCKYQFEVDVYNDMNGAYIQNLKYDADKSHINKSEKEGVCELEETSTNHIAINVDVQKLPDE